MYYRVTGRIMIALAIMMFGIGVFGIADGVHSVLGGGYADNIVLGAIMAFVGPIAPLFAYGAIRDLERNG